MNQAEYIEILLNDCGIDTLKGRNAYLSSVFDREVKYLDDFHVDRAPHGLTAAERSRLIDILKDKKAGVSDRVPLPEIARLECVRQWLARRGIVEGCHVPGEYAILAGLDIGVQVIAIKQGSALVRQGYRGDPVWRVPAEQLRGWHLKRLKSLDSKVVVI